MPARPSGALLGAVLLLSVLLGCATASPRFPQEVQTSFAREDMRKLTTRSLELYYPASHRAGALRMAAQLEACVERLREHAQDKRERPRVLAYLTRADFNNAYVQPDVASVPQQMVLPEHVTLELFHLFNLGVGQVADISCHEAVHYVQMQQVSGVWNALNVLTGGLIQPNLFTESWFLEGLATYYEGRLVPRTGRPHSPFWNGWFEDNVHSLGGALTPGDLAPEQRRLSPLGNAYLTGQHFVDYLARTHGEEKLWRLVDVQGDSILSPFGVTLRFKQVYGRSIGALFEDYAASLRQGLTRRERPAGQQVLAEDVGYLARLASSPADGALALLHSSRERPLRLTVREPDGRVRFSRSLVQYLPGRTWVSSGVNSASGLSFTADGSALFLVMADVSRDGSDLYRLWRVDARSGEVTRTWEDLQGLGGSITPDGSAYVFAQVRGDSTQLVRLELATGVRTQLTRLPAPSSLGPPALSPDGQRIVVPQWTGAGFDLALLLPDGSLRPLTRDGRFNYSPRWVDGSRVVFLREHEGRAQAHLLDVDSGALSRVTDAPHLVLDAAPLPGERLAFLNLQGNTFSVDGVALPGAQAVQAAAAAPEQALEQAVVPVAPAAPTLLSDEPYRAGERLLYPELRFPFILGAESAPDGGTRLTGGFSISGQDRLGFHSWATNVYVGGGTPLRALTLSYLNAQLAPWFVRVSGFAERAERTLLLQRPGEDPFYSYQWGNEYEAAASASRTFWSTPVSFGVRALQRRYQRTADVLDERAGLVGAEASTGWFAGESTAYGGTQRGLGLGLSGGAYGSNGGQRLGDLRVAVDGYAGGLPFSRRDNFVVRLVGRTLPGAARGLLEVGGIDAYSVVGNLEGRRTGTPGDLLPDRRFREGLRGYEDFTIFARNVVLAGASYRYRFIIDRGWASFLYLLPSFFVRQAELNLFAEMARTDLRDNHRAAGAALYLRTSFGGVAPVSVFYQVAKRFDDDREVRHFLGLATE